MLKNKKTSKKLKSEVTDSDIQDSITLKESDVMTPAFLMLNKDKIIKFRGIEINLSKAKFRTNLITPPSLLVVALSDFLNIHSTENQKIKEITLVDTTKSTNRNPQLILAILFTDNTYNVTLKAQRGVSRTDHNMLTYKQKGASNDLGKCLQRMTAKIYNHHIKANQQDPESPTKQTEKVEYEPPEQTVKQPPYASNLDSVIAPPPQELSVETIPYEADFTNKERDFINAICDYFMSAQPETEIIPDDSFKWTDLLEQQKANKQPSTTLKRSRSCD